MHKKRFVNYFKKKLKLISFFSLFIIILVVFFLISIIKHQKITVQQQVIKVEVTGQDWTGNQSQYTGYRPPNWLVDNLDIGLKEYSPDGRVVAEIVDIDYFERFGGNAQVFLKIKLETVDSFSSGKTVYKGKNIEIGQKVDFHFNQIFLVGQVTEIEDPEIRSSNNKDIIVTGLYRNIPVYLEEEIQEGMQIKNPYTNKVYAQIEKKQSNIASVYLLKDSKYGTSFFLQPEFTLRDVELKLKINVEESMDNYYYSGHQVIKVGENLSLFFPNFNIDPLEIKNVEEIEAITE